MLHIFKMRKTTKLTIKFYIKHLKKMKGLVVLTIVSIILGVVAGMVTPFLYKTLIDMMAGAEPAQAIASDLIKVLLFILAADVLHSLLWRVAIYVISYIEPLIMSQILNDCFKSLHKHSYKFFTNNFSGSLVKKISRMSRAFEGLADNFFFEFLPTFLYAVIAVAVLFYLNVILGTILLIWVIVFILLNYYLSIYKLEKYDLKRVDADTKVTGALADTITNNMNIKLFSSRKYEGLQFEKVTEYWFNKTKKSWFFSSHIEFMQAILMIALNFIIIYFAINLWLDGLLSVGDFALIQMYLIDLFSQLWSFGRVIRMTYDELADADEMMEILNTPIEIKDLKSSKPIDVRHGKIEFKKVNFSYEGKYGVIKNLSLKINPSEKIALIGHSGCGKSTIMNLLLRLFDINNGKILIDGQDISKVTQDSLREQITLVPQNPILFHRSLIENIRYGRPDATDEEVFAASKMAHCHEFVSKLPKGYKTHVGERGVKLSGGERQRVAIARAILSNNRILILDEATSNLDSESEKLIQDALKNLMQNKTTLVIAHRLSTIVSMDRILVLNNGEIVEDGSHNVLIQDEDSLYKKLWDLQVGGYLE